MAEIGVGVQVSDKRDTVEAEIVVDGQPATRCDWTPSNSQT